MAEKRIIDAKQAIQFIESHMPYSAPDGFYDGISDVVRMLSDESATPTVNTVEGFDHTEMAYNNGFEAGKQARDEEHKMWEKNAEKLRDGEFGELSDLSTLVRYWEAQEKANYPEANFNVKCYQNMAENTKGEKE